MTQRLWERLLGPRRAMARSRDALERALIADFVGDIPTYFRQAGIPISPFTAIRVHDVLASLLSVYRIESASDGDAPAIDEQAAKARERLRRAMKELEELCAKAGSPIQTGLPDSVKPLLHKAQGVLEAALAFSPEPLSSTQQPNSGDSHS